MGDYMKEKINTTSHLGEKQINANFRTIEEDEIDLKLLPVENKESLLAHESNPLLDFRVFLFAIKHGNLLH